MPTRSANAVWKGGLKDGDGKFSSESGALDASYSAGKRFGDEPGSNPEELLAAAEAACFSMALAGALEKDGMQPEEIRTEAHCTIEKKGDGFTITSMKLSVRGRVPGADEESFRRAAEATKEGCPVSRALSSNVRIEVDAELER